MKTAFYLYTNNMRHFADSMIDFSRHSCIWERYSGKWIVNKLIYAQVLVSALFLISSCNETNRYQNDKIRQVKEFADRRDTEALLSYAENAEEEIRYELVTSFCSYSDSSAIASLLKMAEFDESSRVRAHAAFALGQFRIHGLYHLLGRLLMNEKSSDAALQLAVAVGKSGGDSLLFTMTDEHPEYFKGVFYAALQHEIRPEFHSKILAAFKNESPGTFYAAATLNRIKNPSPQVLAELPALFAQIKDDETKFQLASVLGKHMLPTYLPENWQGLSDLSKIGFMRGRLSSGIPVHENELKQIAKDTSQQILELFAERCMLDSSAVSAEGLIPMAKNSAFMRLRFYYYKAALLQADDLMKKRISEQLALEYEKSKNDYVKGSILQALSAWEENALFIYKNSFETESVVVRAYGVESLFSLFKKSQGRFSEACNDLIERSLLTGDVALCSHAALAITDSSIVKNPQKEKWMPLIENAMKIMKLPRDIETYNDLLNARSYLLGKKLNDKLKPAYNHPIDWDLAVRIPQNMPVKFETSAGDIEVELFVNEAPGTVAAFIELIKDSFYLNKSVHRMVPGFVVQDGCPRGDGFGGSMNTIRTEIHPEIEFTQGTLGMASAGNDTESCQWFITHNAIPHLNGRYTAFGRVTKGMDVLFNLGLGDSIKRITMLPEKSPF